MKAEADDWNLQGLSHLWDLQNQIWLPVPPRTALPAALTPSFTFFIGSVTQVWNIHAWLWKINAAAKRSRSWRERSQSFCKELKSQRGRGLRVKLLLWGDVDSLRGDCGPMHVTYKPGCVCVCVLWRDYSGNLYNRFLLSSIFLWKVILVTCGPLIETLRGLLHTQTPERNNRGVQSAPLTVMDLFLTVRPILLFNWLQFLGSQSSQSTFSIDPLSVLAQSRLLICCWCLASQPDAHGCFKTPQIKLILSLHEIC